MGARPIVITARRDPIGGPAVSPYAVGGPLPPVRRLTILVHGYNNTKKSASEKWKETRGKLEQATSLRKMGQLAEYYWPCESKFQPASKFLYFRQVPRAVACGDALANLVLARALTEPPLIVQFIGHSLGCRLILQAVKKIGDSLEVLRKNGASPKLTLKTALLMAAAVPEGLCEASRLYAVRFASDETVLYSRSDSILRKWFTKGQFLARLFGEPDPGVHHQAVGYTGQPAGRWDDKDSMDIDHSCYWTDDRCVHRMASLLTTRKSRHIRFRNLPSRRPPVRNSRLACDPLRK
jgi:hypothetical protein